MRGLIRGTQGGGRWGPPDTQWSPGMVTKSPDIQCSLAGQCGRPGDLCMTDTEPGPGLNQPRGWLSLRLTASPAQYGGHGWIVTQSNIH